MNILKTNNLVILTDSLSKHYLSVIRDKTTAIKQFREALTRLCQLLAVKALSDIPTAMVLIDTPLEQIESQRIKEEFVVVPILRAGLSMLDSILYFLPEAQIGFIGQKRDEATAQAFEYYKNFPALNSKQILIVDPMLATGGSALATVDALIEKGADIKLIKFICVIAAPEGIQALQSKYPSLVIYAASQDKCLNENKYIVPGLGDAGDLWAGTSG
jgi:uracil phosphoribosyltransferase